MRRATLRTLATLAAAAALAAGPAESAAESAAQRPGPGADLRVYLITFEPGEQIWERFGHNALWIHDARRGTDIAYHYGLFDMSESGFLFRFLQGRMFYVMGAANPQLMLTEYRRFGRDAVIQELRLTPEQAASLQEFLEWNRRPENRGYRYDYFRDNCSTRIRDALDRVLDGALRRELGARPSPVTFRQEALALTGADRLLSAGMDLGLGPLADQPITEWELGFIPMRLRDQVRTLTVETAAGPAPLVAAEHLFPPISRADDPPAVAYADVAVRPLWMLVIGLAVGLLLAGLGWLAARADGAGRRAAAWALAVTGGTWGLAAGVLGLILTALWALTDHEFAHANENLLQVNPLALALVALVPLAALRSATRPRAAERAFRLALALAALSALGLLLALLPLTPQATLGVAALALPVHLGLAAALWLARPPIRPEPTVTP